MDPTIPPNYMQYAMSRESGGDPDAQNPRSSASGLFQFTDGTADEVRKRHPELGLSLGWKDDPKQAPTGMLAFTNDNANTLSTAGFPVNNNTLYLAHRFGPEGAKTALSADPATPVSSVFGDAVMKANPNLASKRIGDLTGTPMADQNPQPVLSAGNVAGPSPVLFGGNPTPVGAFGAIGRMLGIGSEPELGRHLRNAGAGLLAANNPGGAAALQEAANQGGRQLIDAGTDPFTGQKNFVWADPRTGQVTPANISGGAPGAPGVPGAVGGTSMVNFRAALANGVQGENLLKTLPPEVAPYVKALKEGTAIPGNLGRAGPQRAALMEVARAIYPDMDETNIQARQVMAKSMANPSVNQLGGQIQSANTLMNHTSLLWNDIDNLEKLGVTGQQSIWNAIRQGAQTNVPGMIDPKVQAALASFDKHRSAVAGELVRLTRGANGSLQEVQDWKNGLKASDSIAGLRSGAAAVVDLMHGRVGAGIDNYNRVMSKNTQVDDYLTPQAKAVIDRIGGVNEQYAPGPQQQQQPSAEIRYHQGQAYVRGPNGEAVPYKQ